MNKQDRIFDGWADRFEKRIYANDNPKGLIRRKILERDLREEILDHIDRPLNIIDIGGGLGQMASWLSQQGHSVTLAEPSEEMIERAKALAHDHHCTDVSFVQCKLQNLPSHFYGRFDLVICHAVLEWLADPQAAIPPLKDLMKLNGKLSLMFYNKHSTMMRSLVVGDFNRLHNNDFCGDGIKRLAPVSPLDPELVAKWLSDQNMEISRWSGVRTFYDYMLPNARLRADLTEVLDTEFELSQKQPWRSMGRYQHIICEHS